ncbi:beta-hexosaminidase [Burkholderia glumae]|uniref:beta-hexosaminidase n=1 Tax=Burkholderia glumae TaxID=337 RepID=UPI002150D69B|nr:beta-hexosaminidase [Burkholderia glumae]
MLRKNLRFERDTPRGETLPTRTVFHYDRDARRPTTPILVGRTVVMRRPLPDSIYTEYRIMDGDIVVRTQISMPSIDDCQTAINASRRRRQAAELAASTAIAAASKTNKRAGHGAKVAA